MDVTSHQSLLRNASKPSLRIPVRTLVFGTPVRVLCLNVFIPQPHARPLHSRSRWRHMAYMHVGGSADAY